MPENKINISLESKDTATINIALGETLSGTLTTEIDQVPVMSFITTGPAGPAGDNATIADGSITTAKLAGASVTSTKIGTNAVTSSKIINLAVGRTKIANDAVDSTKLADNSVGAEHIIDGTITKELLTDLTLDGSKLSNGIITALKLADSAVTTSKINNGSVVSVKILDRNVTSEKIQENPVFSGTATANHMDLDGSSPARITGPASDALEIKSNTTIDFLNTSGTTVASLDQSGNFTLSGTVDGIDLSTFQNTYPTEDATKVGHITITQAVDLDTLETNVAANNVKLTYPTGDSTKVGHITVTQATNLDELQAKIATIEVDADVNVKANWGQTDASSDSFIQNKPTTMGSGNSYAVGLTPVGSGTHGDTYLRKDGTWATPIDTDTVPDATNVATAGALMDSEVTNLAEVKAFSSSDYATAAQGTKADTAHGWGNHSSAGYSTATGVEDNADVTDSTNVEAAGALMDSEVTNLAQVKAFSSADYATAAQGAKADSAQQPPTEGAFADGDKTKLDAISTSADVTDATTVEAAGALMDSELTDLAGVKGVTISTLQVKPSEGAFANGDKTKLDGITAGATANTGDVTLSGAQTITGAKQVNIRKFSVTHHSTHGDAIGDVIYIGTGATQAGKIYYYASGGGWTAAQADAASTGTGLLAVALGDDPDVDGMLLRGTVTLGLEIGGTEALGSILYLDDAQAGGATATAPDTTNDIVRVIGYSLSTDNDMIWFNPDGAWVEHA